MRRRLRDERGITLPEIMIAIGILSLVGGVLFMALNSALRVDSFTAEDSQALGSLRTATERFQKELRQARTVYDDSTDQRIRFWVDYDRDNQQDPVERVIWELQVSGPEGTLTRETDAGGDQTIVVLNDVLPGSLFTYSPAPPDTTIVNVLLIGEVVSGNRPSPRAIEFDVRLRNAAA